MKNPLSAYKVIDLTHPLSSSIPSWNGSCGFCLEKKQDYDQIFLVQQIKMHGGIGTHMDAPCHRFEHGLSIGDFPLEAFLSQACVIDVSSQATADYQISTIDIEIYEKTYGTIPEKSVVIGYTGWDRFWNDNTSYRNPDAQGMMHFPSFSKESAELLKERKIAGIAIDTLSPDSTFSDYPVHRILLGANIYIIENIANAHLLPPQGAWIFSIPLKMPGAAESPTRVIGLVPIVP